MASTSDPRAAGFDPAAFIDGIKFAMSMGAPNKTADKVTFYWEPNRTFTNPDVHGNPYNRKQTPASSNTPDPVIVDVAVEFVPRSTMSGGTPVGDFETPRAVLTLLGDEYEQVKTADYVTMGGNKYFIDFVAPPMALFSVDVYQIHVSAESES